MAEQNAGKVYLEKIKKCGSCSLPDLEVPKFSLLPWNLPSKVCQEKFSSNSSVATEVTRRIACCKVGPRPRLKEWHLSESYFPVLKPFFTRRWNDHHMGEGTLRVPMSLFAENRKRLCNALRSHKEIPENAVVVLQGGSPTHLYNTDVEYTFRQEPYFHWAFGVIEPDCYGAIDVSTGESILFIPRLGEDTSIWTGPLKTLCDFKDKYEVDKVEYTDQIKVALKARGKKPVLLLLRGRNTDSQLMTPETDFDGMKSFDLSYNILFPVITELRVFKTEKEIEVLRYANKVSSEAHKMVMKRVRPGMKEHQCESVFLDYCYYTGGSRHTAYTCICASGHNAGVLHYGHAGAPNDKKIEDGDICCFDMGCSYFGYASDITCTFPANGKFTEDQKLIYNAVLAGSKKVYEIAKPGISWVECHRAACRKMLECLKEGGLLKGNVEEMMEAHLDAIFQPHGLGHLIGCDVHDVGGYTSLSPERPAAPGFNKLRTARILQPGMALTVEPGCYFIPTLLDRAMENPDQRKFLVPEVLNRFRKFGGVRIEDDVIVTENGLENLTKVPRTVEEIESWMAKSDYTEAIESLIYGRSA